MCLVFAALPCRVWYCFFTFGLYVYTMYQASQMLGASIFEFSLYILVVFEQQSSCCYKQVDTKKGENSGSKHSMYNILFPCCYFLKALLNFSWVYLLSLFFYNSIRKNSLFFAPILLFFLFLRKSNGPHSRISAPDT